jgi:acetyl esterase
MPHVETRPLHELTVAEARKREAAVPPRTADPEQVSIDDLCGPVAIRLYRPRLEGPLPLCIWLPGGGWVLDTLPASDEVCGRLASQADCAIAAVRYRLAPEHPYPSPLDDVVAAVHWLFAAAAERRLDPGRMAIGGTSAGANLAAAAALLLRDRGGPALQLQILLYPPLLRGAKTESMAMCGDASTLDARDVEWCWSHYLARDEDGVDPYASPLRAQSLAGLPPALVLTAEHDPLRDEGERYAERLREDGVEVEAVRVHGASHGFFSGETEHATAGQQRVVETLRRAFGTA